jgi:Raf kinase inhibitor-like YbhB/YbcL family protein
VKVFCPALLSGKYIPNRFAHKGMRGGQNVSLPVLWGDVPPATKSFVLTITDRHPIAKNWVHWYVVNIPPAVRELSEGASSAHGRMPEGALELRNSFNEMGYGGPKPPRGTGPHEYVIAMLALSVDALPIGPFTSPEDCAKSLEGLVIDSGSVVGIFQQ